MKVSCTKLYAKNLKLNAFLIITKSLMFSPFLCRIPHIFLKLTVELSWMFALNIWFRVKQINSSLLWWIHDFKVVKHRFDFLFFLCDWSNLFLSSCAHQICFPVKTNGMNYKRGRLSIVDNLSHRITETMNFNVMNQPNHFPYFYIVLFSSSSFQCTKSIVTFFSVCV